MEAATAPLPSRHGEGSTAPREHSSGALLAPRAEVVGSICTLSLFIAGKPVAKARPRFKRQGNFVKTYTPETTAAWEQQVVEQARLQVAQLKAGLHLRGVEFPFRARVICAMRANFDKPKSYPKRIDTHLKKPDLDNVSKSVLDGLAKSGLIQDDNIVTDLSIAKRYSSPGHPEGVEVELTGWL